MRLALGLGTRPGPAGSPSATSGPAPASHDPVRQRRRFAQDGDVPVVMLHRGRDSDGAGENKVAALTADLREERSGRLKAERALEEANGLISSLKTKLKHAEMTLEEKMLRDAEARTQWDALLATEREARQGAETRAAEAALALSVLERKLEAAAKSAPVQIAAIEPVPAPAMPDLFGEAESVADAPAAPKRRMSKKASARLSPAPAEPSLAASGSPEPEYVEAAPQPKKATEQTAGDEEEDKPIEWWLPSFRATRKPAVRRKRAAS